MKPIMKKKMGKTLFINYLIFTEGNESKNEEKKF